MKKLLLVVLMLIVSLTSFAQNVEKGSLFKTYTNFVATSDDTTGWMNIPEINGVLASEWGIIGISSDSIQAVVNVLGRNSKHVSGTTYVLTDVYTDSISSLGDGTTPTATAPETKVIMLKDGVVNRLEACDQFKTGTVFGVAGSQGTTSGRYLKWYLWYQK